MATNYQLPRKPRAGDPMRVGWADSVVRSMGALRPVQVPGMLISRGTYGTRYTPIVSSGVHPMQTGALLPFFLRYHEAVPKEGQEGGNRHRQVEVYLPRGSMTTIGDCVPLNPPACLVEGHGEDSPSWRVVSPRSGNWSNGTWRIEAFVMPGKHMIVRGTKERDESGAAVSNPTPDAYDEGAIAIYFLATMTVADEEQEGGGTEKVVTFGEQANTGAKSLANNALYELSCCSLEYEIVETYDSEKKCYSYSLGAVTMTNVMFDAGGSVLVADDEEVPDDAEEAWLKVKHASDEYSVEVAFDPDDTTNTDDVTWRKLYDLAKRYPTADVRFVNNTLLYLR